MSLPGIQLVGCRIIVAGVLAVAGFMKLFSDTRGVLDELVEQGSTIQIPSFLLTSVAIAEIALAVWLLLPRWRHSLLWICLLVVGMAGFSVASWLMGTPPASCGCFGSVALPWAGHFAILLGLVLQLYYLQSTPQPARD